MRSPETHLLLVWIAVLMLILLGYSLKGAQLETPFTADTERRFAQFMQDAAKFERELDGCPVTAYEQAQCDVTLGVFDTQLKNKVWREGAALFYVK